MEKIIFLRNKKYRPSSYYRIFQYILKEENKYCICEYESNCYYENKLKNKFLNKLIFQFICGYYKRLVMMLKIFSKNSEYTILVQREVFPKFMEPIGMFLLKQLIKRAKEVYWEFDDNIFDSNEITKYEADLLMKYSKNIVVGNTFLKNNFINEEYHYKTTIINTTDKDLVEFDYKNNIEKALITFDDEFKFVWLGTSGNLIHLEKLIFELEDISKKVNKKLTLKIVSDKEFEYKSKNIFIINKRWGRDSAINDISYSHIGLMPLIDNEITKGKCSFKAVQYMAMGMPIAISPVGMNKDIVNPSINGIFIDENFSENIIKIINDKERWIKMAKSARNEWNFNFNPVKIEKLIKETLNIL